MNATEIRAFLPRTGFIQTKFPSSVRIPCTTYIRGNDLGITLLFLPSLFSWCVLCPVHQGSTVKTQISTIVLPSEAPSLRTCTAEWGGAGKGCVKSPGWEQALSLFGQTAQNSQRRLCGSWDIRSEGVPRNESASSARPFCCVRVVKACLGNGMQAGVAGSDAGEEQGGGWGCIS